MESSKNKNVLIVEDDDNSYLYIMYALDDMDYNIIRANNGLEAINLFRDSKIEFEFILMDLKLPIIDGFQASSAIRKIDPEAIIIAQTASYLPLIDQKLKEYKFDSTIIKPFTVVQLIDVIENALNFKKSIVNTTS